MGFLENKYVWQRKQNLYFYKILCIFPDFSYKNYKEFYILFFPQEYKSGRIKCDE